MSEKQLHKKKSDTIFELDASEERAPESPDPAGDPRGDEGGTASIDLAAALQLAARLQSEKDELTQTMVRRQADFENYRKRVERDRQEEGRRNVGRLLEEIVPALDSFERAMRAHDDPAFEEYRKGLELIYRQLWETLSRNGLERIDAKGKAFDPNFHQAIERVETREHPDGAIVDVLQDGFLFHGRVLRPSIVRVAVDPQDTAGQQPPAAGGHLR